MASVIKQMHRDTKDGKPSSKKIWGSLILLCVMASYVVDGLHFYTINENLFNTAITIGASLIGFNALKEITSIIANRTRTPKVDSPKEDDIPLN